MAKNNNPLVSIIDRKLDVANFREQHWEGTFWEYLDVAMENPAVSRNAFQRVYDMILSYGAENYTQFKQELVRYKFFADPIGHGADAKAVSAATGAFVDPERGFLQSTGFVLNPDGQVVVSVYSSGAIGRLVPDDVIGLIRYLRDHAPATD